MLTQSFPVPTRSLLVLLACAGAAACTGQPPAATPSVPVGEYPGIDIPVSTRVYEIDPAQTRVTLLVHRSGPLARLGHNHAIVSGTERGAIWVGATPAQSGFEIHVPVASLVVDDPEARAAAGADFPGAVPDDARAGTTANMLRAEVLDAAHYPDVVVRATGATGTWERAVVHATAHVKDLQRDYDVPVTLTVADKAVTATGAFQIRQTDFGITPFSVAGGAIQVADVVDVQ
ncbi:MAG TPA: YceI family protein, partial [Steroidobacteraceae bacterium]